METDDALFLDMCKGVVTLRLSLAVADTSTANPPEVLLAVPRNSYIPLHLAIAIQTWEAHTTVLPGSRPTIWMDADGAPLPWHLPAGVVADRLGGGSSLRVTVNYSNFPTTKVVPFFEEGFEAQFRHVIKASVCCMYDKPTPFMQHPSPTLFAETDAMIRSGDGRGTLLVHRAIKNHGGVITRHPMTVHTPPGGMSVHGITDSTVTLSEALALVGYKWDTYETVVVQGLQPSPTTPFLFAVNNLVSADMTLHVVLQKKK